MLLVVGTDGLLNFLAELCMVLFGIVAVEGFLLVHGVELVCFRVGIEDFVELLVFGEEVVDGLVVVPIAFFVLVVIDKILCQLGHIDAVGPHHYDEGTAVVGFVELLVVCLGCGEVHEGHFRLGRIVRLPREALTENALEVGVFALDAGDIGQLLAGFPLGQFLALEVADFGLGRDGFIIVAAARRHHTRAADGHEQTKQPLKTLFHLLLDFEMDFLRLFSL